MIDSFLRQRFLYRLNFPEERDNNLFLDFSTWKGVDPGGVSLNPAGTAGGENCLCHFTRDIVDTRTGVWHVHILTFCTVLASIRFHCMICIYIYV